MSSIDKYVTDIGRDFGANVRCVNRNGVIRGYIDGTEIFSFPDRYGYINTQEVYAIQRGIQQYKRAQSEKEQERARLQREAEERARREEELRRARELEEKRRLERLEQERKEAVAELRSAVREKRNELLQAQSRRDALVREIQDAGKAGTRAVKEAAGVSSLLDFSEMERAVNAMTARQLAAAEHEVSKCRETMKSLEALEKRVKDNLSTEQCYVMLRECKGITVSGISSEVSSYSNNKLLQQLSGMKQQATELLPAIRRLESLKKQSGEIGIIATEALNTLQHRKITDTADLKDLAQMTENRFVRIQELVEAGKLQSEIAQIEALRGAIAACRKTYEMAVVSTYTAKDFRPEIEELAEKSMIACKNLEQAEFTSLSTVRRNQIEKRLEEVVAGDQGSSEVLRELEQLMVELVEYAETDKLHIAQYHEYCELVEQLSEYGVDKSDVPAYDVNHYVEQKSELIAKLAYERREAEKSRLLVLDMQAKIAMEKMGFEEFFALGDADGYVRETMFTKKGYDGVLWQIITCADGSISRRVIGVNENGRHETNPEYVLEIAEEMEGQHDPEQFLQELCELVGEPLNVAGAVEHDSEEAAQAIAKNGYFYLNEEAVALYKERVAAPAAAEKKRKTAQPKQICVPDRAVQNTSNVLVAERMRMMQRQL